MALAVALQATKAGHKNASDVSLGRKHRELGLYFYSGHMRSFLENHNVSMNRS